MNGLSVCTFEVAVSCGKVKQEALKVQAFSDAIITVSLVVQTLLESGKSRKSMPVFESKQGELAFSTYSQYVRG